MSFVFSTDPRLEFSPLTRVLILLNIGVYLLILLAKGMEIEAVSVWNLALSRDAVLDEGMLWTLVSYMFLHADPVHLGLNMLGLYLFGPDMERACGHGRFLVLYGVSGLMGGVGFLLLSGLSVGPTQLVVGASGAIMGLLGAVVALYPKRVYLLLMILPMRAAVLGWVLLISHLVFILTPYGGRVAYDVHLFGGVAGYGMAWLFKQRHRRKWDILLQPDQLMVAKEEFETLVNGLVDPASSSAVGVDRGRYAELREILRYEDVLSVEELRVFSKS